MRPLKLDLLLYSNKNDTFFQYLYTEIENCYNILMTIIPHALTGAAAAALSENYFLAFWLGFVSHFVLDALPHLEPKHLVTKNHDGTKTWSVWLYVFVLAEIIFTIVFFYLIRHHPDFNILIFGLLGGLFPDMIVNNPFLQWLRPKPIFKQFFSLHDTIHLDLDLKFWPISFIVETLLIGGAIWYLLKF